MKRYKTLFLAKNRLYCFTPEVSLATFLIEVGFALYVFFKYKSNTFTRVCIGLLLCLGLFQLSEFMACRFTGTEIWLRLGYITTIFLPAFGMHMSSCLTKRMYFFTYISYIAALLISTVVVFAPGSVISAVCLENFVQIYTSFPVGLARALFYDVFLLAALGTLCYGIVKRKGDSTTEAWLIGAYLVFLFPTAVLYYFRIILNVAVPSVMCGFAILTACIVTGILIPRYLSISKRAKKGKKKK